MAKVTLNDLLEAIRGRIGDLVFRRRPDGTLIVSGAPRYRKKRGSPKQKAYWQYFKGQTQLAKALAKTQPIYAELAAASPKWLSPYNIALSDCLKPPVIECVERAEGCIRVQATDEIGVVKVWVTVRDAGGAVLAAGEAVRAAEDWWEFPCPVPLDGGLVTAEAWDLPGNVARMKL